MQKLTRKKLLAFLAENKSEKVTLDVGAGAVLSNHQYTSFFPNRISVDIDPEREPDVVGDIHSLPFNDNEFEQILCTEVLEHCVNPQKAVNELKRVLKPGGKLILTTRFVYPIHDAPNDYYRYTKYGLLKLFEDWREVNVTDESTDFEALFILFQRLILQTEMRGGRLSKALLLLFASLLKRMNFLIVHEYGDVKRSVSEKNILCSGYYVIAQK